MMWSYSLLVSYLLSMSSFLVKLAYCVPTSTNQTAPAVNSRQTYGCFSYRPAPPSIDRTAPVMDCARALLQFPKNAPPGKLPSAKNLLSRSLRAITTEPLQKRKRKSDEPSTNICPNVPARFQQLHGHSPHRYYLPQTQFGPAHVPNMCVVQIEIMELPTRHDETSSWSAITATGSLLIQACSIPGSGAVGGWTLAGDDNYMRITIGNSRYLASADASSSEPTSTTSGDDGSGFILPGVNSSVASTDAIMAL